MKHVEIRRQKFVVVPIDVVWQIVEPAETLPSWFPMCDRCELLSGEGLGRRQRMHARWGGRSAEIDAEVTDYRPSSRLAWRHVEERLDGKPAPRISSSVVTTVELHAESAGTRVVLTSRHEPAAWWSTPILRLIAGRRIGKAFEQALARLASTGG